MIKLTLTPETQPITYIFEKDRILVGKISDSEIVPDLVLSYTEETPLYIKIELVGSNFIVYNLAEDPFITVNGCPFNKKSLKTGDLLQIGTTVLLFEGIYSQNSLKGSSENGFLVDILAKKMDHIFNDSLPQPIAQTSCLDLDAAMQELEELLKNSELTESFTEKTNNIDLPTFPDNPFHYQPYLSQAQKHKSNLTKQELEDLFLELDALEEKVLPADCSSSEEPLSPLPMSTSMENDMHCSPDLNKISAQSNSQADFLPTSDEHNVQFHENTCSDKELEDTQPSTPQIPHLRSRSMKDDFLNEVDESIPRKKENVPYGEKPISISWKMFFSALGALLLLAFIVISSLYFAISGRNEEEEIKAAQAVADVAMALNSALINHAQPQNHNWSDPDFLNHTLAAVLAAPYHSLANVDSHGHFKNTSYLLRIYTGDDLNHFLIIAQPSPNLLQWIMPKAAITVDSSFMELRKISDLKTLNRLLINATLDTSNSTNIANLVKLGELIPLSALKKNHPHAGFDHPKALAFIRPGAENLIYNSSRYYPLGESLMKKAISIYDSEENGHDLIPLIDEISQFTRFPDIILYSSEGMQMAQRGNKALATFFPHYKFLYAYLKFNQQRFAHSSHLLIDDNDDSLVAIASIEKKESLERLETEGDISIDQQHPLYYKLVALYNENEQAIKPISDKIEQEKLSEQWDSARKLAALQINYDKLAEKMHEKILEAISELQREYSSMPFTQFMNYIRAAKIESHLEKNLQAHLQSGESFLQKVNEIKENIEKIKQSTSINELDLNLTRTSQMLTLEAISDPKLLISLQNEIHSSVVHKIDALLLFPEKPLPPAEIEGRDVLTHILKTSWVTDESEFDYYLHEYDLLSASQRSP